MRPFPESRLARPPLRDARLKLANSAPKGTTSAVGRGQRSALATAGCVAALAAAVGSGCANRVAAEQPPTHVSGADYTLDQAVNTFNSAGTKPTKVGFQYWFFDKKVAEGRTLKMSAVGPHEKTHPPHTHDGHEFFYVLQGQAEFFLNGESRVVGPDTGLYCPPGSTHGIANAGDTELRYLVIKRYEP